jgi:hypothetical protein
MTEQKPILDVIEELRAMRVPELVARYTELHGRPPRVKHREWLWQRCAWKEQERRYGGLSQVALRRIDELIADMDLPLGRDRTVRESFGCTDKHAIGTQLVRDYKGQRVVAIAVEGGWECQGEVFRSLTAVAKAVTGSHWNGRAFFGVTEPKRSP